MPREAGLVGDESEEVGFLGNRVSKKSGVMGWFERWPDYFSLPATGWVESRIHSLQEPA